MKKIFILCVVVFTVVETLFSQFTFNLPVDTITSGVYAEKNPVISSSEYPSFGNQWLLYERYTNDSSFIVGKKIFSSNKGILSGSSIWDTIETIIARSPLHSPLTNSDIASLYISNVNLFCAVWQKKAGNYSHIYYSLYNDSGGVWSEPIGLAVDSAFNENPIVRVARYNYATPQFFVIWSKRNILFHACVTENSNPIIDTLAVTKSEHPQFDATVFVYQNSYLAYSEKGSTLYRVEFTAYPFSKKKFDSVFVSTIIENPRFLRAFYSPALLWEQNYDDVPKIMGANWYPLSIDPVSYAVSGIKYDICAFTSSIVTRPIEKLSAYVYLNLLTYTWFNGKDTTIVIHAPWNAGIDTIKSAGYNSSASIGTRFVPLNGKMYLPVAWESNRTGRAHIYGKLVYSPVDNVEEENILPKDFVLYQNFPNPFNPATTIRFSVPENLTGFKNLLGLRVILKIYDALGREVATLVNEEKQPGNYSVQFNASKFSSGVYFYKLQLGNYFSIKKMQLLK